MRKNQLEIPSNGVCEITNAVPPRHSGERENVEKISWKGLYLTMKKSL